MCLELSSTKTNPTLASLATTKQINTCSSILTYVLQLLWSRKHVRRGVYSRSRSGSRCPIFNLLPQAVTVNPTHLSFPLDIASSPLRSPVSSPSFSELSTLEEQHLSVLDENEKLFTQSQQVYSPSSRKGVLPAPARTIVSSGIIPFGANITLKHLPASSIQEHLRLRSLALRQLLPYLRFDYPFTLFDQG